MKSVTRITLLLVLFVLTAFTAKALTASFTTDVTAGCSPLVVNFTNTSTGGTSYVWDFGNGIKGYARDGSTSYTSPGTYTATLTTTSGGVSVTTSVTITVYPGPTVSFTADDTSVCPGQAITFKSTTIGGVPGPVTYSWAFGDGFGSTLPGPTHTYGAPGFYNVTLTATNDKGCVSTLTQLKFVHIFNPAIINFSSSSTYFCKAPGHAVFTDYTSGVPAFTYSWAFGDGFYSSLANPVHDYSAPGSYDVHLAVKDGNGCMDSVIKYSYITVGNLKAAFTFPAKACAGTYVSFPNTSSSHISSSWDYNDGGTDVTDPGGHVFAPGTYKVRLIVFDGKCYDTMYHIISIVAGPVVNFTIGPKDPCPPPISLNLTGTVPTGSTVTWAYSDGGTGSGVTTSHLFAKRGVDTITMTVTDPATGCTSVLRKMDTLYDFNRTMTDSPSFGCVPLTVYFKEITGTSEPDTTKPHAYPWGIVSYLWDFGDGTPPAYGTSTPVHTYTAPGVYKPFVKITTANGCVLTDTGHVKVGKPPIISVTALNPHVCYGIPIQYVITVISGPTDNFHWEFRDYDHTVQGEIFDSIFTQLYIDKVPGVFTVKVTPEYNGCIGIPAYVTVTVDSPKAIAEQKVICNPPYHTGIFVDSSLGDDTHVWVFGDGTTSTLDTVHHNYPLPNLYGGYLATYNKKSGCRDTVGISADFRRPVITYKYRDHICLYTADTLTAVKTGAGTAAETWFDDPWGVFDRSVSLSSNSAGGSPVIDTFYRAGIHTTTIVTLYSDHCTDTSFIKRYVGDPKVNFNATPTTGCAPLSVNFTDASVDSTGFTLSKYAWTFGDGGTALVTSKVVPHTFTTGGTFSTKLVVTDNYGCVDSATLVLVTAWKPKADFYTLNQTPCVGDNIQFINKSIDGVTYSWDFGDGGTSAVVSPFHTYTTVGNFTVSLTVTDAHGCTDVATFPNYIATYQPNVSFYMVDSFSICPPLMTNFHNTSTGAIFFAWDMGDGNYSSLVNPSDIYTAIGYYTVTLTGTDAKGCKATAIGHASIYGYAGGFTYTPLIGCSPLDVHFKALISNVPNIIWDFSDGSTSKAAFTDTADHTYTLPGSYVPKLILSDNSGCQNSSIGLDTIKVDLVTPGYTSIPNPVCVKNTIAFNDTSTSFFSTITSWAWTMPDGSTTTTAATTWYYDTAGTYPMTFTVTDGWGCTGTLKEDIIVHPLPVVDAGPDTIICLTDKATLIATGAESYSWTPGATLSCATCNPVKASPLVVTTYSVTGTDKYGCMNIDTVMVSIKTKTVSHATGDAEVCRGVPVSLHDSGGTSYVWTPGTGLNNPNVADPIATPPFTQRYTVIAYLGSCIPDTEAVWVTVHQIPTVNAGEDQRLIEGSIAQLDATGTLIEKYSWVQDGTITCDSCLSTQATMSVTTTYVINVASDFGCKASDTVTIHIYCDNSQIFVPNTFTPNGDGQNDVFYPHGIGVKIVKSFRIYNRWGQLLFEKSNIQLNDVTTAWDGSYNGNSPKPDVYVYVLDAVCATGEPINIKGDVTIIR